jgi:hypothetical protein
MGKEGWGGGGPGGCGQPQAANALLGYPPGWGPIDPGLG